MGSFEGMVNTSREVDGNMKWQKMEDPTSQMQEYMNHSADFQRRLVSVRESRALLEKNHRMRKERVSHMGFQFKQILWQMRRAQEDAYLAQERYLKLLQLIIGSSQLEPRCKSEPLRPLEDQDTPFVHHHCAEDLADLDLIQGIRFRFYTAAEVNNDSVGRHNGDAHEIQSYLTMANNNELSTKGRLMNVCGQDSRGELESIPPPNLSDDFASTSVFVCSNLDSQNIFLEQKPFVIKYNEKRGQDGGRSISLVQECTGEGNMMRNNELDLPVSIMPTSPMMKTPTTWNTEWREDLAKDMEKSSPEDARMSFLKIQKSDFLSQRISKELEDFTKNSSSACCVSKPTTIADARMNEVGPFKADSTPGKTNVKSMDEIVKSKTTEGAVEETRLTMEEKRKIMKAWHPNEKLEVLATITNTMFLWDIEHTSNQEQQYGSWAECEPMISVALAARGSQEELFDFLETVTGTMSRPMLCCGAVCELLKAYPPEKLLPFSFIEDFFASELKESKDQKVNKGLTFDHLEVYQEEEHAKVWQMLVHHAVSVNDHKLASLRQIAQIFVEILLPSNTRTKGFPIEKIKDMHQGLLEFFVSGFKSKTIQPVHVHSDDDKCPVAMKRLQQISKITGEDDGSEIQSQINQTGFSDRETKGFSTNYRSRRSGHLRPVSSRMGLFSCFGSMMRTKFRIWRMKALSEGVDTIDDAVVCLLRNRTQETSQP